MVPARFSINNPFFKIFGSLSADTQSAFIDIVSQYLGTRTIVAQ
jgi:hypothetical protein